MPTSKQYARNVARGLCGTCGKRPPEEGRRKCGECLAAARAMRAAWKEAWRCVECGAEPRPNETRCDACAEASAAKSRRWFERNRAAGNCRHCARPPRPGRVTCGPCGRKVAARARERYHLKRLLENEPDR